MRKSANGLFFTVSVALCAACGGSPSQEQPGEPKELGQLAAEIQTPVGIAVDGATGERFVLDAKRGLFSIAADGTVELVFDTGATEFTDVVSLGDGRFALTARNDGFLLDLERQTLEQHFCYLPPLPPEGEGGEGGEGGGPGIEIEVELSISQELELAGIPAAQHTDSVGFSPALGLLYAQPQTINLNTDEVAGAELGFFDATSGDPVRWTRLDDPTFLAGGLAATSDLTLLMAQGSTLYEMDLERGPQEVLDLAEHGVERAEALALDDQNDTMLIIDGADRTVVEISQP